MGRRENLFAKLYKFYKSRILPHIIDIRGTTRLKIWLRTIATLRGKRYPYPGETVLDYKWDYLIVIDACRYDLFEEEVNSTVGMSNYKISVGSDTTEWFNNTFKNKYYDLIYISGNPVISKFKQSRLKNEKISFFRFEPVWEYGWNEKLKSVPPREVTRKAIELNDIYRGKKMIIHYLQPHYPFIGKKKLIVKGMEKAFRTTKGKKKGKKFSPWKLLSLGIIKEKDIWRAYKLNLKLVMEEVGKLRKELNGRMVLCSDHGNCKGEYGIYAHPRGVRIEELVKVPWKVLQTNEKEEKGGIRQKIQKKIEKVRDKL